MTYEQLKADIKNKIFHPIYLLQGEEGYYIDKIADDIEENALSEAEKGFNQTILYGKDTTAEVLLDVVRRYPMMGAMQVVILKEAQQMKGLDKLMPYFEKPLKSTIFVICHKYKKIAKNTRLYKVLDKNGVAYTSAKLYDNQIPTVIKKMAEDKGYKIKPEAQALLAEYLGADLSKIEMEVNKLALNLPPGSQIDTDAIEKYIGISKDYNVFEFRSALCSKDKVKAFKIVNYFIANPKVNPPVMVIAVLASFFNKAYVFQHIKNLPEREAMSALKSYPFEIKDLRTFCKNYTLQQTEKVVALMSEYDLKSKGVGSAGGDKSELLTEMTYRMMA